MYIVLVMLLSAVLAIITTISLVKNFLVNFNVSDNGWKTALVATLIAVCLLCALISYSEAFTLRDINFQLSSNLNQEEIDQLKNLIPIKKVTVIAALCTGYVLYFIHILLIKNIRQNKLKDIESNAGRRWTRIE